MGKVSDKLTAGWMATGWSVSTGMPTSNAAGNHEADANAVSAEENEADVATVAAHNLTADNLLSKQVDAEDIKAADIHSAVDAPGMADAERDAVGLENLQGGDMDAKNVTLHANAEAAVAKAKADADAASAKAKADADAASAKAKADADAAVAKTKADADAKANADAERARKAIAAKERQDTEEREERERKEQVASSRSATARHKPTFAKLVSPSATPPPSPKVTPTMSDKAKTLVASIATTSISERVGSAFGVDAYVVKLVVMVWVLCFIMWGLMSELACTVLGFAYPMYQSFKALTGGQPAMVARWLRYWVTFAVLSICEIIFYPVLSQNRHHHLVRFVFIVWLFLPQTCGADKVYNWIVRPLMKVNSRRIDGYLSSTAVEVSDAVRSSAPLKATAVQGLAKVTTKAALATMQAASDKGN
jgi:hypothetical protein